MFVCPCDFCQVNEAYYQVDSLTDPVYDKVICKSCWENMDELEKTERQLEVSFIRY